MNFEVLVNKVNELKKTKNNIEFDEFLNILNDEEVKESLDKQFKNKETIYDYEIKYSQDYRVQSILEKYVDDLGIEVISTETEKNYEVPYIDNTKFKLLSREEEIELARRIKQGDIEARNELVERNLKLVISIARRYTKFNLELSDIISYGNIGLISAAERFDPDKNCKFSTYATWWIRQTISRGIAMDSKTIRLPVWVFERAVRLHAIIRQYEIINGKTPSEDYLASKMEMSIDEFRQFKSDIAECTSLDIPVGESEHGDINCVGDFIKDESDTSYVEDFVLSRETRRIVLEVLEGLSEREKNVLLLRFGFVDNNPYTLKEVGQMYGVTRERIRQIENKTLKKIRIRYKNTISDLLKN